MNSIVKRVLSGAAALGIALSGLALGAASANAEETKQTVDPTQGTITIANQASWFQKEHTFKGYHLASLTGVSAIQDNGSFKLNPTFNVVTDPAHKQAIIDAMKNVKLSDDPNATYPTLGDKFTNKATTGGDPMSWLTETEQSSYNDSIDYPWGNGKTGAGEKVMRQFANALAKQLKDTKADQTDLKSSVEGYKNEVQAGLWLLVDTTTSETLGGSETGSSAILTSSTYKNIPYTVPTGDGSATTVKNCDEVRVLGDSHLGEVEVKNSSPAIAKEVVTYDHDSRKDGDKLPVYKSQENPTYNIGDTVTYMLYSRIPIYNGYPYDATMLNSKTTRQFKIQDFASKQLTVNDETAVESVRLVPSGQSVNSDSEKSVLLKAGEDYDVKVEKLENQTWGEGEAKHPTTYDGGQKTIIDLGKYVNYAAGSTSAKVGKILEDYNVEVVFKATLNKDAKISDPDGGAYANPNYVNLQFSNSASDCSQTGEDWGGEVNVYTFKFQIKKTSKDGKTLLPGAEFKVKDVNADKYLIKNDATNGWSYTDSEKDATTFTSNDKGMVTGLDGLKAGQYEVKETKQPEGYSQFNVGTKFTVDIDANFTQDNSTKGSNYSVGHNNTWGDYTIGTGDENGVIVEPGWVGLKSENGSTGRITVSIKGNQAKADEKTPYQANVWNAKDVSQLPLTGGAGLLMIVAVGVLLFGAAGILAVRSRKAAAARHSA